MSIFETDSGDMVLLEKCLADIGLKNIESIHWNLSSPQLYEAAVRRREARLAHLGPLVTRTGTFTGRAPHDKFIVDDEYTHDEVMWGNVNQPFTAKQFDTLFQRACDFLEGDEIFVTDGLAGADPDYELPVRIITQHAWHALFSRNMFIRPENVGRTIAADEPRFTLLHVPELRAMPSIDGTNSEAFVILNFTRKLILVGGTRYAGEIKKSVFSVMNHFLPKQGVMSMHAAANMSENGDVAVFFGLSGTGKTTLSADPTRKLIGDDEHGWGDHGVFNIEGGCYAKVINLSKEHEPLIYATTRMFGTILENVGMDTRHRRLNLEDDRLTENTRASYPVTHIPNCIYPGIGGHPKDIVMLTCDAFGVLPPISRLTAEQAMYHFLSGYTAKVAGTEEGIVEPTATFSACFGAPFMPLHQSFYGKLLGEKIHKHNVRCWLINTGWSGGPYGVGERMDIHHTRAMLSAALHGELDDVAMDVDPIFQVAIPRHCPGIPDEVLQPVRAWQDAEAYQEQARKVAQLFQDNFYQFAGETDAAVRNAGPVVR
ncbi:MAG: phosphoenolpyruvate carboxykinase (ATP) [Gammaproteobacteria bacterium]